VRLGVGDARALGIARHGVALLGRDLVVGVALVFGVINAILRPILKLFTFPLLILTLGLFTRPAAFILSGEMAFAYFMEHTRLGIWIVPMLNQGESAVLFCFIFLFLAAAGAGAWGVDTMRAAPRS
jgi:uncharacterized membrane protein YphA (DoxX/SURF4 family)